MDKVKLGGRNIQTPCHPHFAVRGGPDRSVDFDIAHAIDPDRIEMFAIGVKELQTGVGAKLQDHFGDRFRLLT
jgi:hypothetical protein